MVTQPDTTVDRKAIGRRLQALRQKRGVLLAVVAKATGIPLGTLGAYECGARLPCVPNLIKLAWYHRRTVDFLLRGYHERR